MSRLRWRWHEKDFGFRFIHGSGRRKAEYYHAANPHEFYVVPASQRKLEKDRIEALAATEPTPTSPPVVPNPWQDYDREWDWITTSDGILLNFAGCLNLMEIHCREDDGVARAMEYVIGLLERPEPQPLTINIIRQIHRELMGEIYPFAGEWRRVAIHKGDGPTKWPLPPGGI